MYGDSTGKSLWTFPAVSRYLPRKFVLTNIISSVSLAETYLQQKTEVQLNEGILKAVWPTFDMMR